MKETSFYNFTSPLLFIPRIPRIPRLFFPLLLLALLLSSCSSVVSGNTNAAGSDIKGAGSEIKGEFSLVSLDDGIGTFFSSIFSSNSEDDSGDSSAPGKGRWRDSDIKGIVTEADVIRPQDDFASYVNQEWIAGAELWEGAFDSASLSVARKKREAVSDLSISGKDVSELRKFVELAEDWEGRNEAGFEPLKAYIDAISSIESLEDLGKYLCDMKMNPLGLGLLMPKNVEQAYDEPTVYQVILDAPELSLEDPGQYFAFDTTGWEKKIINDELTKHVLLNTGFQEAEISEMLKANYRVEREIAGKLLRNDNGDIIDGLLSYDECVGRAGNYPLAEILKAWGFGENAHYRMDESYVSCLPQLYNEANLSDIKAMLLIHLARFSAHYLDRDTYDLEIELSKSRTQDNPLDEKFSREEQDELILFNDYVAKSPLGPVMDWVYVNKYTSKEDADRLLKMTEDIIKEYEVIFSNEEWLSEEGRKACIDKLHALNIHVIYPDYEEMDYSMLNIRTKEEGGSFFEAVLDSRQCLRAHYAYLSSIPYDNALWDPLFLSTTMVNAFYSLTTNGIYIMAGFMEEPFYEPGMSYERLLGGIGVIVGHEITHGFDKNGAEYNKFGVKEDWMPMEDKATFSERNSWVANYYSTIHPFRGSGAYNGSQISAEATADMGGLRATLSIAKKESGFDYDAYFRQFASIWREQVSQEIEAAIMSGDEHPLNYLRVNVGLQQFPEFYDTYNVRPEDGMYLEEARRIAVW